MNYEQREEGANTDGAARGVERRKTLRMIPGLLGLSLLGCSRTSEPDVGASDFKPTFNTDVDGLHHPALTVPADRLTLIVIDFRNDAVKEALKAVLAGLPSTEVIMVGFGASLFTKLGRGIPHGLKAMPPFPGEILEPRRSNGDLLLHIEGDGLTKSRRIDALISGVSGLSVRWRIDGYRSDGSVLNGRPVARNPFGFIEGHGNAIPTSLEAERDVLVRPMAPVPDPHGWQALLCWPSEKSVWQASCGGATPPTSKTASLAGAATARGSTVVQLTSRPISGPTPTAQSHHSIPTFEW